MDFKGTIICTHFVGDPPAKYTLSTCPRCLRAGGYGGISTEETGDATWLINFSQGVPV